jgi:hypothetical protein
MSRQRTSSPAKSSSTLLGDLLPDRRHATRALALGVAGAMAMASCGGQLPPSPATAPPPAPPVAASPPAASAAPMPAASTSPAHAPPAPPQVAVGTPAPDGVVYDQTEDPTHLTPLFAKGSSPAFPAATISEQDCWQTISVSGAARKDYESIIAKCGASTGSVEYVRPTQGKLHHKHDKRDTFIVPIHGGYCYRFFGVADSSIADLDILIEKNGGDLVGDDKTNGPVAIIESDKAWCIESDGVYNFLVEVDGEGHGDYVFGIWARKNKK